MAIHDEFSSSTPRNALAIFCRAPRLGTVKTRLAKTRSNQFALDLYKAMLRDSFALGRALAPGVETFACFTPSDAFEGEPSLKDLWDGPSLAQCGGDLGAKMLDCFGQLKAQGYEKIALIGSDSPDLPLTYLQQAFELLESSQITVGASQDGGFYLLGASTSLPSNIFEGITWSSESVLARLQINLEKAALAIGELPLWRDVDEEGDLESLQERLFQFNTYAPHTRQFLSQSHR
jgi:rSAM/selenodomain-associated transferase 1